MTIDASIAVGEIVIRSEYSGTITQAPGVTLTVSVGWKRGFGYLQRMGLCLPASTASRKHCRACSVQVSSGNLSWCLIM